MRILHVTSGLALGGAERQVILLSRTFVRDGHQVCVFVLNAELARADELQGSGVELEVAQKRGRLDWRVLHRLRQHIRRWRPDIVHGWLYDGNLYARLAAAGTGVPVLNSERNDDYHVSATQRLGLRLTARGFDALVANTHAGAEFARPIHGTRPENTYVVWNGIDLAEVTRRVSEAGAPAQAIWPGDDVKRVCVVGSIKPQKDHELAMEVMRSLVDADPSWRMICVGDALPKVPSGHKARVMAARDRLGLQPYVAFTGHRRDIVELMSSCDVVLVTSLHEGFPNVVLEAMASGTPVASTAYSDVRRILPQPWQVAANRSPASLADIVRRCRDEREALGREQREWVGEHATIDISARNMLNVYRRLVRSSSEARTG